SLYADILLKIQSHYVHSPDWQDLVRRGILNLDVALTESVFLNHHFQQVDLVAIDRFRRSLRELYRIHPANDYRRASEVANLIAETAKRDLGLNHSTVMAEFTSGAAGGLDTYSAYLTGHQLSEVQSQIEGNFVGLGVELKTEEHRLHIVNVIPGGPAAEGGVRGGQTILAVDGQAVAQISPDAAADMLKGEEGSSVTLTLGNPNGQAQQVRLVRKRVDVPSVVDVSILDQENGIGYLRVTSFQKTTTRDIDNALWDLHRQGMRSLIFDVRGNPGGLLTASVEIADKFISTGTIVSTRGRSSAEDYDYRAHSVGTWRVPLIVLIDGDSASASEIFAGAIRDHQRGQVIGQRSYGKGSVQGIFPMDRYQVGVRLTTAKFYSPSGQPISDRGVTPTIAVPVQQLTAKPNDAGQLVAATTHDAVLRTGLQVARDQLSRR
ncbi:MAG TPA: peptidase S41, partial [Planctomycetaceae bacterium]|nr:peptidase S41 [Planctomycetaceae bacterium]